MPILSVGQKAERALKLLLGVERPPVAQIMGGHGFTEADRQEGWRCLSAVTGDRFSPHRVPGARLLERLDAWQDSWFPIADTDLQAQFPSVHAWLFQNLTRAHGPAVVPIVSTFVQRLLRMPTDRSLGSEGTQARELLIRRGLDAETVRIAVDLLELLSTTPERVAGPKGDPAEEAAAQAALWRWYRKWSEVARGAIPDCKLLHELGSPEEENERGT